MVRAVFGCSDRSIFKWDSKSKWGNKSTAIGVFSRQNEDICKMAGPLIPLCVNKMFSSNCYELADTILGIDNPARLLQNSNRGPLNVRGTNPGRISVTERPNCCAI